MLPLQNGKLQLQGQTGMMYEFESFPTAAVKARFTGLGDGMITEMKSEVEVSVARFKQPAGAGTAIHFTAADIAADSAHVEFTGVFVRTSDHKPFPFRVLFGRVQDGRLGGSGQRGAGYHDSEQASDAWQRALAGNGDDRAL
jgi:hypothetical protein